MFVQESERLIQNMVDFQCPPNFHITQKSCHFGNQTSILSYQPELDQNQILDILTSYPFPEIELEDKCESELQFSDSSLILESISTPVVLPKLSNILEPVLIPIISELESSFHPFTFLPWTKIKIQFSSIHLNLPKISRTILTFW